MSTPAIPVFNENFDIAYSTSQQWGEEWTHQKLTVQSSAASYASGGYGYISPASYSVTAGAGVLSAMRWKDSTLDAFEIEADLYSNADASASRCGLIFCWDGSIDNANGYFVHAEKITLTSGNLVLYKLVNGVATTLATGPSAATLGDDNFSIFLRVTNGPESTRRIEFSATRPSNYNSPQGCTYESYNDSGSFANANYIGICNSFDYNSNAAQQGYSHSISPSNFVGCNRVSIRRLATGTTYISEAPNFSIMASGANGVDAASFATSSISPTLTPGNIWLAFVKVSGGGANVNTTTLSGAGLTWTSLSTVVFGANTRRFTLFRGAGTPTAGALTISNSAAATMTGMAYGVLEISGASLDDSNTLPIASLDGILLNPVTASGSAATSSVSAGNGGRFPDATSNILLISAIAQAGGTATTTATGATTTQLGAHASPATTLTLFTNRNPPNTTVGVNLSASAAFAQIGVMIQPSIRYIGDDVEGTVSTGAYQ